MNEKPILFNTEMVQAILEGRKTQTRRVVKNVSGNNCIPFKWRSEKTGKMVNGINHVLDKKTLTVCPFGKIGDRLWVRETFCAYDDGIDSGGCSKVFYRASEDLPFKDTKWKPSIHMPRWACRLELEITGIHVEHLQEISEEDAEKEGARPLMDSHIEGFNVLWVSTGGNWQENPWVWVIDFKVVEGK